MAGGSTGLSIVLACVLLGAAPAVAAPGGPKRPLPTVADARLALARARAEVQTLTRTQQALAREIDALKRDLRERDSPRLTQRLNASVALERRLERADANRLAAASTLSRTARLRIRAIDAEMARRSSKLRTGPLEARRLEAKALLQLREERVRLREELRGLDRGQAELWASYRVEVDPLDGPNELREKADFLEDARDKLQKKRAALVALVDSARRRQRMARTAREFAAESDLFDEETRPGRITRGQAATPSRLAVDFENQAPAPVAGDGPEIGTDSGGFTGRSDDLAQPPAAVTIAPAPSAARDLGPLLQLDPTAGDLSTEDPKALQALIQRLDAADRELRESAERLRKRARNLDG